MVIVVFIHANGQGSTTEDFCQEIYSSGASSLSMKTISINVYQKHAVKGSCICVIATSHVKYVWYARELRFMITKFSRARATEGKNWFFSNRTLLLCSNVAKFSLLCIDTRYLSFFRESQKKKLIEIKISAGSVEVCGWAGKMRKAADLSMQGFFSPKLHSMRGKQGYCIEEENLGPSLFSCVSLATFTKFPVTAGP